MGAGASAAGVAACVANSTQEDLDKAMKSLPEEQRATLHCALLAAVNGAAGGTAPSPLGLQLIASLCYTTRFDTSRPVPQKAVLAILEACRSLPTSANTQPWTVIVTQGGIRDRLVDRLLQKFDVGDEGEARYAELPETMPPRMAKAVKYYEQEFYQKHLGVDPSDTDGRHAKYRSNYEFWGAPVHIVLCAPVGPCLLEKPPVDGVFLDMGSLMVAISLGAHDHGLGAHPQFSLAKHQDVYREVLGQEQMPDDVFVVCGLSIGWPEGSRDPRREPDFLPTKLSVSETTRWGTCDSSWLSLAPERSVAGRGTHGLLQLIQSRHCSHSLDTSRPVAKEMIDSILAVARNVPSVGNSQPWQIVVIQGEARDKLSNAMLEHFDAGNDGKQTYKKYSAHNTEQMQKGKDTYGYELYEKRHGLERGDTAGRRAKYRPNYEFWGAPVLLLLSLPKCAVAGTFIDVGAYMMAILLGMHAYGLGGKPLGSVAKYTEICQQVLGKDAMPDDEHLVCGICIGWPSAGRDPRETPDWFPSRFTVEETTRWACDADWLKA
mmetsp:Transcript_102021/g.288038  ORF Transcript_102021/g.288038 Transcript_102021/m.288038 type:complete len:547 (-) Transcript_102021:237-1877(-)|eukprot:CAMPEP_0117493856 /NCGR_PEP_ID=MMETSP0784-20121206/19311_1 /TAXON_ID=39447 /ORGANISM="" /LENGTH=546 /DNA_ID=CAMNT_0005288717 /DNA_START=26 /DNA_END=1666 /DNA_ORIENTATION=-